MTYKLPRWTIELRSMKQFLALILLVSSGLVEAQSTTNTSLSNTSTTNFDQTPRILRWRENLRIGYFGELLGPSAKKWDDNQYDMNGNKTGTPMSYYNQFMMNYRFLPTTSFLVSPRFFTIIGDRNDLPKTEDQHNIYMDDLAIGITQEFYRDQQVTWRARLTHRHPINAASKNAQIKSQAEYQNDIFWMITPSLTLLEWTTFRYYVYESDKNENRYRLNNTAILSYIFNDKWKMQFFHEIDLQHRAPKEGPRDLNKQKWNYFEKYRNHVAVAVGYSPTPDWTFLPFIKMLNDERWDTDTAQLGFWVLGRIF